MRAASNEWLHGLRAAALTACLAFSGCHSTPYVWVHNLPPQREQPRRSSALQVGDGVEISVFGQESLTLAQKVGLDGTITLPLIGPMSVVGMLATDLAKHLTERWRPFVNDPRVTVVMHEAQVSVTVVGEVAKVGVVEVPPPASVLQVLATVGGLGPYAHDSRIFVLRTTAGKTQRIRFSYDALLEGRPSSMAFRLQTGDIVVVE